MDPVGFTAVLLIFGFIPLLACAAFVAIALFSGRGTKRSRRQEEEEIRWMQQMNDGLMRLGDRVDALETLLMDQAPRPESRQRTASRDL
jgi:phage shock protein B